VCTIACPRCCSRSDAESSGACGAFVVHTTRQGQTKSRTLGSRTATGGRGVFMGGASGCCSLILRSGGQSDTPGYSHLEATSSAGERSASAKPSKQSCDTPRATPGIGSTRLRNALSAQGNSAGQSKELDLHSAAADYCFLHRSNSRPKTTVRLKFSPRLYAAPKSCMIRTIASTSGLIAETSVGSRERRTM